MPAGWSKIHSFIAKFISEQNWAAAAEPGPDSIHISGTNLLHTQIYIIYVYSSGHNPFQFVWRIEWHKKDANNRQANIESF